MFKGFCGSYHTCYVYVLYMTTGNACRKRKTSLTKMASWKLRKTMLAFCSMRCRLSAGRHSQRLTLLPTSNAVKHVHRKASSSLKARSKKHGVCQRAQSWKWATGKFKSMQAWMQSTSGLHAPLEASKHESCALMPRHQRSCNAPS